MEQIIDLSISVVSYNTKALIKACLDSIKEHTKGISYEIILVDNASKDGTAEMVEEEYPDVLLIRSPKNLGFPSGSNLALEKASGRYFVLFNSDAALINDAFTELVNFMDKTPQCGITTPQLYYPEGHIQKSHYPFRTPEGRAYWEVHPRISEVKRILNSKKPAKDKTEKKVEKAPSAPVEIERPRGVCFMIRMDCVREIGPMDGNFFIFSDEVDWAWRAKKAGWKRYIVPAAKVEHAEHGSISQRPLLMQKIQIQSDYYYYYKHFGIKGWLQLRWGYLLGSMLAWLLFILTLTVGKKRSDLSPVEHKAESIRLFKLAFLTKKVLPPDAV